jgi:hypothetical protein
MALEILHADLMFRLQVEEKAQAPFQRLSMTGYDRLCTSLLQELRILTQSRPDPQAVEE